MTSSSEGRAPTPSDEWRKTPARKNKVRWCGGHEGREHQPVIVKDKNLASFTDCKVTKGWRDLGEPEQVWSCIHHTVCGVCGRVDWHTGSTPCPDKPAGIPYGHWKRSLNDVPAQ